MLNFTERIHIVNNYDNESSFISDISNGKTNEESFFVCNIGRIIEQFHLWQTYLPRVYPHYAVKCNDNTVVLEVLATFGIGFDCASKNEIQKVLNLGVDKSRIIYANPNKFISHIRYAAEMDIRVMTFDNESELHKIQKYFPNARLLIRIRCDDKKADYQMGIKFGCDYKSEAPDLLRTARDLDLNVFGVSFHVGSSAKNPNVYRTAIRYSREVFDYAASIGHNFTMLDIGGGFPGHQGQLVHETFYVVNDALDEFFSDSNIQIIAEPGRFFVASSYTLACSIISHRNIQIANTDSMIQHNMYYIPDGIHGSFSIIHRYRQKIAPILLKSQSDNTLFSSSVWGPTCDGIDQVCEEVFLPQLTVGDWLIFENMGAYCSSGASNFNGIPITKVLFIGDNTVWLYLKDIKHFKNSFKFFKSDSDIVEILD